MVDGLLDSTRELLGRALTTKQKEQVIEPARAVPPEGDMERKPPQRSRASHDWGKCLRAAL